jgi:transposase
MLRQQTSRADKQRLIQAYHDGKDYVVFGKQLGIKESTSRSLIQRFKENPNPQQRGGHKKKKITDDVKPVLLAFIEENPLVTLDVIKGYLESVCGVTAATTTISNYLDAQLITVKKLRDVPSERNSVSTKERRFTYAKWMIENDVADKCIYVDECGFNLWTKRSYGRAKKGSRCFIMNEGERGQNLSLCMAIGLSGIVHYKIIIGAYTNATFSEFLTELSEILADAPRYIVMDNCRIHYNVYLHRQEHTMVYLPPYSPFLNPIESAFSALKADMKERLTQPGFHAGYTQPQRRASLMNLIVSGLPVINAQKCHSFYRHSYSFMARCIEKVNILGD